MADRWGPKAFAATFAVSRETVARLEAYADELHRWNPAINLVGPATLPDLWWRHFADSAQLWRLRPPGCRRWIDLGSGAGFPGAVVAILAAEAPDPPAFALVESDRRKAAFLSGLVRRLSLPIAVHPVRAEALAMPPADVVSARALAPVAELLPLARRLLRPEGRAFFLKGRRHQKELDDARRLWTFDHRLHGSLTDPEAAVIEIGALHEPR